METLPISSSDLWINALILLVSVLCVAFFSSSEASLISVNKIRIRNLAEQGNASAQAVQKVLHNHEKFFATILLTENAFIIFASSVGTALAISLFGEAEQSIILATLTMTVLVVIFGEITPKTLASLASERVSLIAARPISLIMRLETPLIAFFTLVPRLLIRLLGRRLHTGSPFVTEAELRMLIDIGQTEGTLESAEIKMLHRVFEFTDRLAKEVMTPRPEIQWVDKDDVLQDLLTLFAETFHTRYLLCDGEPDNILGVINMKDVLRAQSANEVTGESSLQHFMRPVLFVPETKRIGQLFEEMRSAGHQMAVIVDEYGGTAGLVTLKQLIEEIVGRVGDETTGQEQEYESIDEHTFQVEGAMRVDEAREALGLNLPEGDYETVAGYLLFMLGHIPQQGELVRHENYRLIVAEMSGVKIDKVLVTRT